MHRRFVLSALMTSLSIGALPVLAQPQFPTKTVTLVVPLAAGGGTDIVARKLAMALQSIWGQNVIVDNVPGASSIIGTQKVARSPADGHTLLVTTNGPIVGNRFLFKSLPYDPDRDLVPIAQVADIDMVVLAHKSLPANNLKELVALAKKDPSKVSYASYGIGSQPHLLFELFKVRENIDLLHVPYKGLAPALTAVMAGESMLTLTGRGSGDAAIRSGKTKVINYNADQRDPVLPDVPSSNEMGYPYFKVATWHGVFGPRGLPPDVLAKIHRDVQTVMRQPEFRDDMAKRAYGMPMRSPQQFAAAIAEEVKATGEMVKAAGMKAE